MFRLDHIVVHIDGNPNALEHLKETIEPLGFPFEPAKGKGTKGFKVANIWVGDQYFEMPYLKRKDGGGWKKEWVMKYNQGKRGLFCIFIMTDELDNVIKRLKESGVKIGGPERIRFKMLGFLTKTLPWRLLYTPEIPGTNLQIAFIQMDDSKKYEFLKKMMKPNARENGIDGFQSAVVQQNYSEDAWTYIQTLFPECDQEKNLIQVQLGDTSLSFQKNKFNKEKVIINVKSLNDKFKNGVFFIENVEVNIV